jgi:rare lipoprotein A
MLVPMHDQQSLDLSPVQRQRAPGPAFWLMTGVALCIGLAGCSTSPSSSGGSARGGGYYQQDGPGESARLSRADLRDAVPRVEPLMSGPNKPYTVLGRSYTPETRERPFRQTGVASWYGKQFHGRQTSSGERYDMYAMTAAHPTLPIPSYARVTEAASGVSVIVRINDRGPFLHGRVIDLSYAAAHKLGYVNRGSTQVTVERILPEQIRSGSWQRASDGGLAANPLPSQVPASRPDAAQARSRSAPKSVEPAGPLAPPAAGAAQADPIAAFAEQGPGAGRSRGLDGAAGEAGEAGSGAAAGTAGLASLLPRVSLAGIYLQLGAFRSADGAESLARHLSSQLDGWATHLALDEGGGWYRLQAGPYVSRGEAERAAEQLRQVVGMSPLLVERP